MSPRPTAANQKFFVLAGMPRAGTTYIYHALAAHPEAFVPFRKELRYFSFNFDRGEDWYMRFFREASPGALRVDISPDYFMNARAPLRLRDFTGCVKIALGVRDPASWAVSLHRQLNSIQRGVPRFRDFLSAGKYPSFGFLPFDRSKELEFSLRSSFVKEQLAAFRSELGDRLLLYDYSTFERCPLMILRAIESFAGISSFFAEATLPMGRINAGGRKSLRWFNYLSSRDVLINLAGRVIPRRWLVASRMKMDRASATGSAGAKSDEDSRDLEEARDALSADTLYVADLFAGGPLVLGSGANYAVPRDD